MFSMRNRKEILNSQMTPDEKCSIKMEQEHVLYWISEFSASWMISASRYANAYRKKP